MIKHGICTNCSTPFKYNSNDRLGKFCSQKCHFSSKQEKASCPYCHKEFIKRKKENRKSCSSECFLIGKGMRSKSPQVKDFFVRLRNEKGGQSSIVESFFLKVRRAIDYLFPTKLKV